ncbi:uncharacterized protein LOC107426696 isoform X2 [Ziziphus jujuba]|uniref:Uncharacterized protein LOC107426696 isoform X2 n=1 Tax=Ziziphus jujuba TaxID=326968 RepID=A0A6P4AT84_ZIZJJ|nr:uncharacterized protein LOC107426696 isoform X2 [Ziziphus jujuba]
MNKNVEEKVTTKQRNQKGCFNQKIEFDSGSKTMETGKENADGETQNQNPLPNPNIPNPPTTNPNRSSNRGGGSMGKSCKGCLYYSSIQKSKSKNPTCVGFSRTLQQVPSYIVGETELEASKEGRSLTDFKYACIGYSVFLNKKDSSNDPQNKQAELPFCVGLEVLLDKRPVNHDAAHANKSEEKVRTFPQPRTYKPPHPTGDEYLNRFKRNAGLVASGVARNVNRVCNYVKESLDDILYPYRRRPK